MCLDVSLGVSACGDRTDGTTTTWRDTQVLYLACVWLWGLWVSCLRVLGWVCGVSCVVVDCTPPPSTKGTADSSKLRYSRTGFIKGLLDSCPSTHLASMCSWGVAEVQYAPRRPTGETNHCNASPCVTSCIHYTVYHTAPGSGNRPPYATRAHPKAKGG